MIQKSDLILIVNIEKVEKSAISINLLNYTEMATANVIQVIKGNLVEKVFILGGQKRKNTKVCYEHYSKGIFLVLLKKSSKIGYYQSIGWQRAIRSVNNGMVHWYKDKFNNINIPLSKVIKDITNTLHEK